MGFLDTPQRIDVGGDEWIDIKRISADEFRALQEEASKVKPAFEGDDQDTAENFEILRAIRERIVAWSDDAPVTPENIKRLPVDINTILVQGIMQGVTSVVPLPITAI